MLLIFPSRFISHLDFFTFATDLFIHLDIFSRETVKIKKIGWLEMSETCRIESNQIREQGTKKGRSRHVSTRLRHPTGFMQPTRTSFFSLEPAGDYLLVSGIRLQLLYARRGGGGEGRRCPCDAEAIRLTDLTCWGWAAGDGRRRSRPFRSGLTHWRSPSIGLRIG
jgi:hypothetical protein